MINVWSVSQLLQDVGALPEDEAKKAIPFCVAACAKLSKRLKDIKYEDEPAVINACAGIALYNYTLLSAQSDDDMTSFKAGDVTITRSPSVAFESAVKFRDEAMLNATDYLTDVDFVFQAVEI